MSWQQFNYSFIATSSTTTVVFDFAVQHNSKHGWALDNVSVKDSNFTELLTNGNFESGSLTPGWISYTCGTACSSVSSSSTCYGGLGSCYTVWCTDHQILQQAFNTIAGHTYSFSFELETTDICGCSAGTGYTMSFSMT